MNKFWMLALLLSGCAMGQSTEANLSRCQSTFDAQFHSGQISRLDRAKGLRECNVTAYPESPYMREYWDYFVYIAAEHEAGRVGLEQARMLISKKEGEINERRAAAIQSVQPRPVYPAILPSCWSLPPGLRGYAATQGKCY